MINFARKYYHALTIMVLAALIAACGSGKKDHLSSSSNPDVYYSHSVAFHDTALYSWGANTYGQLGNGDDDPTNNRYIPVQVVGLTGITGVSAGGTHILAFINNGNVYAWGNNGDGQLGNNSSEASSTPVMVISDKTTNPVTLLSGVTAVSAGGSHSLALRTDGTVWAWGSNDDGKLGVATADNPQRTAVQVTSLTNATKVAAGGGGHSLALMSDKTVKSWGRNTSGQLGVNSTVSPITTPGTVVKGTGALTNVTDIAAGRSHSLFLLENGEVWACGYNFVGQLGVGAGDTNNRGVAVQVAGLTGNATQIAAGFDHSLALINGEVWAWGLNNYGQLGNGALLTGSTLQTSTVAVKVLINDTTALSNIVKIVAIGNHNLAVDTQRRLWVWGYNSYGELGLGEDAHNQNFATMVTSFSNDWGL